MVSTLYGRKFVEDKQLKKDLEDFPSLGTGCMKDASSILAISTLVRQQNRLLIFFSGQKGGCHGHEIDPKFFWSARHAVVRKLRHVNKHGRARRSHLLERYL